MIELLIQVRGSLDVLPPTRTFKSPRSVWNGGTPSVRVEIVETYCRVTQGGDSSFHPTGVSVTISSLKTT